MSADDAGEGLGVALDKEDVKNALKAAMESAFAGFDENPSDSRSCLVGAFEDVEGSRWRGAWTERVRGIVRERTPSAACVCVKPLPLGNVVWYSIDVAER